MKEVCSCGAKFEFQRPDGPWNAESMEKVYGWLVDWRTSHRHDMPEEALEPPLIHESVSHHERAYAFIGEELRA